MAIVKEVEKIIAELPPHEASIVQYWLDEFEAARRYKKLKACAMADKAVADFNESNSNASWN